MRELTNIDFEGVYYNIIDVMDLMKVDDTNIQLALARVKPHVKKFDALKNRQRNKNAVLNEELTRTRTDYLISLRLRIQSFLRSHLPEERVAAKCINFLLKGYGKKYYVPSILTQTIFVDNIVFEITQNEDFKEAFTLLRLNGLMDTIEEMTEEIMNNLNNRISEDGVRKERNNGVRTAAYKDMKIMIDIINFMYINNKENEKKRAEIEKLMWFINRTFKAYRTPMRSLQTKRKNRKALAADAVQELGNNEQDQEKELPMEVSQELIATDSVEPIGEEEEEKDTAKATPILDSSITSSESSMDDDELNNIQPKLKNENDSNDSTISRNDKEIKGDDKNGKDKLPPVNMN